LLNKAEALAKFKQRKIITSKNYLISDPRNLTIEQLQKIL